jgi:hypothetical protein
MIKRAPRQPKHRNRLPANFQNASNALVAVVTASTNDVLLTFTRAVNLNSNPATITIDGTPVATSSQTSPYVIALHHGSPVTGKVVVIPAGVAAISTASGGVLAPQTVTV